MLLVAVAGGFLESAAFVGLVVPGETLMLGAGMLSAAGVLPFPVLLGGVVVAAIAGDSVGYWIGRRLGPAMRTGRLGRRIPKRHWDRAELSGGQAQRVAVARALAARTRLILADEPTGQLDRSTAAHDVDVLLTAARLADAALLIATHDRLVADRTEQQWPMVTGRLTATHQKGTPR